MSNVDREIAEAARLRRFLDKIEREVADSCSTMVERHAAGVVLTHPPDVPTPSKR